MKLAGLERLRSAVFAPNFAGTRGEIFKGALDFRRLGERMAAGG